MVERRIDERQELCLATGPAEDHDSGATPKAGEPRFEGGGVRSQEELAALAGFMDVEVVAGTAEAEVSGCVNRAVAASRSNPISDGFGQALVDVELHSLAAPLG